MAAPSESGNSPQVSELTGARALARNSLWSLLGQLIPVIAAAVAVPLLLRALGAEAFGILTISWTVIGYFTLFDFGLGRALTRVVAEGLGSGRTAELPALVATALLMLLGFGLIGAVALGAATPWVVRDVLRVPAALDQEARATFWLLAVSLPAVLLTAGLSGVLAAYQQFRALNLIRIPMSLLSFILPMAALNHTRSLAVIVGTIVAVRFVGTLAHVAVCAATMPGLRREFRWVSGMAAPLLKSGGWIAVINLIFPLFASMDRILLGAWTSVGTVAYYVPPQEMVTKLWIIPGTLVSVLFPAFAASHRTDPARSQALFLRGLTQVYCALLPVTVLLIASAGDLLRVWLGAAFQQNGQAVLQYLATGAFFTGLSFVPSALIQGVGRPRNVAWLLILELPPFLAGLWWGVHVAGATGAAAVWALRAFVDLVALFVLAVPCMPGGRNVVRGLALPAVLTLAALAGAFALPLLGPWLRVALLAAALVAFGFWAIRHGLADERRAMSAVLLRHD